jgi:uncharacterized protein (UPF0371 family)
MKINGVAFDNEKYLEEQSGAILERIERFDNKLYLEFGGKLLFDHHASRVLPGFDPNVKMRLLSKLSDKAEIIICIYAGDIERKKMRADFGISYDADTFKLIDDLRGWGLEVRAVVITRFTGQPAASAFKTKLERPSTGLSAQTDTVRTRSSKRNAPWSWSTRRAPTAARWRPACPRSITNTCEGWTRATRSSRPFRSGTCP